ncbi:MAG: fructosamine kinase family protein [Cyclobacteriaceae bacterium]
MTPKIQSLVEKHLSQALHQSVEIIAYHAIGGGCINHAMRLQTNAGDFFLKWNEQGPEDLFICEAEGLEALRNAKSCLRIPMVILALGAQEGQPGLLVTEFLPPFEGSQGEHDEYLGRGIAQIHECTHAQFGFTHNTYCGATLQDNRWNDDWIDFFGQQRIWYLVQQIETCRNLRGREHQVYEQLVDRLPEMISHQPKPSLNHGDLWSGNYMYSAHGPALIDPACYYADREFDLAMMAMFGGFSERVWDAYQEYAALPEGWEERLSLYQLYHYLNHYYLFGGHYGQQALAIAKKHI